MTPQQYNRIRVAKSFAHIFAICPDDQIEIAAMQLHAALQDLAHVYEGEMFELIKDVKVGSIWEEEDADLPL